MNREAGVFLAKEIKRAENFGISDEYERIDKKEASISQIKKDIKEGIIKDAFTICSFYAYLDQN